MPSKKKKSKAQEVEDEVKRLLAKPAKAGFKAGKKARKAAKSQRGIRKATTATGLAEEDRLRRQRFAEKKLEEETVVKKKKKRKTQKAK